MLGVAPISKIELRQLPPLAIVVLFSTALATIGGDAGFGVPLTAVGWIVPLLVALITIISSTRRISLPYLFWLPWVCIVIGYLMVSHNENALQRSVMILTPLVVGVALSKSRISDSDLNVFLRLVKILTLFLAAVVIIYTGLWQTGVLSGGAGTAAQSITASLLAALFATRFGCGLYRDLWWWMVVVSIPFLGLTRMAMFASAICMVITPAPMKITHRLSLTLLIILVGLPVFYSERMQNKMFISGEGDIWELSVDNENIQTTGRAAINAGLKAEVAQAPWLGHGANASEEYIIEATEILRHPHNDWLRFAYDYGYLGVAFFLLGVIGQFSHALMRGFRAMGEERVLYLTGACSLVVQALLMLTDNVVLYAAFFGNLQFAILGLAYARRGPASRG